MRSARVRVHGVPALRKGLWVVCTTSKSREDWDWGEVVEVSAPDVAVAWHGSRVLTTQPIPTLRGARTYPARGAAHEAYVASLKGVCGG